MKKKNLTKKLQLKKAQISNLSTTKAVGGVAVVPWTTRPACELTTNCTEFASCINCLTDLCTYSCRPDVCTPFPTGN